MTWNPVTAPQNPRKLARKPLDARLLHTTEVLIERIRPGLSKEEALAAFLAACNQPDTMFITDRWIRPTLDQLRPLLSDPISPDQAKALQELAAEKTRFDDVFDWLGRAPMGWDAYWNMREREDVQHRQRMMEVGLFPWPDVEASRADEPLQRRAATEYGSPATLEPDAVCPRCGQPVTWFLFRSPDWTWQKLCGRAGWIAVCDPCHLQIDFKLCLMN